MYKYISDDSIYRNIVFDIDISYRIVSSKKISMFSIHRDILIYRNIFGIIIGVNTCAFLRQTLKAFSVFVISTFGGDFVQGITEDRVIINRTALRVTQTHIIIIKIKRTALLMPGHCSCSSISYTFTKYRYRIDIAIFGEYRIDIVSKLKSRYRVITSVYTLLMNTNV